MVYIIGIRLFYFWVAFVYDWPFCLPFILRLILLLFRSSVNPRFAKNTRYLISPQNTQKDTEKEKLRSWEAGKIRKEKEGSEEDEKMRRCEDGTDFFKNMVFYLTKLPIWVILYSVTAKRRFKCKLIEKLSRAKDWTAFWLSLLN
jgi:hypothetical protein